MERHPELESDTTLAQASPRRRLAVDDRRRELLGACLDWVERRDVPKSRLVRILAASVAALAPVARA